MKRLLLTVALFASAPAANALAQGSVAAPLSIDLRDAGDIDGAALRSALEADLGVPVALGADHADVAVESTDRAMVVRVARAGRPPVLRSIDGSGDRSARTLRAALLISNLVRDESAELLALLAPAPAASLLAIVPDPAPRDATTSLEPPDELPKPVRSHDPSPREVATPRPTSPALDAPAAPPRTFVPVALDFVPGAGVSTAFLGGERRAVAIGAIGAWTGELTGVSISGVFDLVGHEATGVQIGGVAAITGPMTGVQIAGVAAIAGGPVSGVQLSLVNVAATELTGAQVGLVNTAAGPIDGAQVGLVNVAAGRVSGVQIGLVNVSDETDASIGLVNAHAHGRLNVRAGADTTGLFGVSLVHGSRITHSILSLAIDPLGAELTGAIGLGLGVRIAPLQALHVDIDALAHVLLDEGMANGVDTSLLVEPRVIVGLSIVPDVFGVYAGASYQWLIQESDTPTITGPVLVTSFGDLGTMHVHGWPALHVGVELF